MISKDQILLEIVQNNPLLASVIDRFGIPYAKWTLTLEQACHADKVDAELLVEMLRVFQENTFFPSDAMQKLPLNSIIEYLIKTHIYYINSRLPRIEQFIELLVEHYGKVDMQLFLLRDYFLDYKRDMLAHICIEERNLFPYILKLLAAVDNHELNNYQLFRLIEENAITKFINDHIHVEGELQEIRRRLLNYTNANKHKVQVQTLFYEMKLFEVDLLTHGKVEDEVLVPRARQLEDTIKRRMLSKAMLS
jgi:regulator of cell morphogenesis and NO signaling